MGLGLPEGATTIGWSGLRAGVLVKGFRIAMAGASVLEGARRGVRVDPWVWEENGCVGYHCNRTRLIQGFNPLCQVLQQDKIRSQ